MNELCYVYCAVEGHVAALPSEHLPDGAPPRAVALYDVISLVISSVPAGTYSAASLEPKLNDLDWVAAAGAAHHAVIDALAARGLVVLPFRLFTIFSSEQAALAELRERSAAMARAFDHVRGREEWVLRIGTPDPSRIKVPQTTASTRSSGTNFLQAKADAKREAAARAQRVQEDAAAAFDALASLADAARTRDVEVKGNLVYDAAFLVRPECVPALQQALSQRAERLLRDGCPVSLTGPWPPYSFASLEGDARG